ncbi:bifunctional nuclease family protein [Candidatus Kapaibacterium sp.]
MEKIQLLVLGLSASPASNNAYALILKEVDGDRRLPIIIGSFEAQAIALEMEGVVPPRPMTHDLIRNIIDQFDISLSEVFINDMVDGTFYAKLIFETLDIEIDCRPSDAIAIAVRCSVPIYVSSDILDETGVVPQDEIPDEASFGNEGDTQYFKKEDKSKKTSGKNKLESIQLELEKAIREENYELAASLRDELKKFSEYQ